MKGLPPGREEIEKAKISDYLSRHSSMFAFNLATALKNQMDRDRRVILTKMMYEKDTVSPYIFRALTGLWDLMKEEINGDADHNRTEAYYDEVVKKAGEYAGRQFYKDFARDLAMAFLNEVEDRDKAERSEKEEKSA